MKQRKYQDLRRNLSLSPCRADFPPAFFWKALLVQQLPVASSIETTSASSSVPLGNLPVTFMLGWQSTPQESVALQQCLASSCSLPACSIPSSERFLLLHLSVVWMDLSCLDGSTWLRAQHLENKIWFSFLPFQSHSLEKDKQTNTWVCKLQTSKFCNDPNWIYRALFCRKALFHQSTTVYLACVLWILGRF